VGDGDRTLMVDDFDSDDFEMRAVVDSAQTPPFLTERRVVVARGVGRFNADDVAPLVAYLADPLPTTELVLVAGGGRMPKALTDALKKVGGTTIETAPPSRAKERAGWFDDQVRQSGLKLDGAAMQLLTGWLGEDAGRLQGILETLAATYGKGTTLRPADVSPFLGDAGCVPPWDLTDAIDNGDVSGALDVLDRMLVGGSRHPLQVLAVLNTHYLRMLQIDSPEIRGEKMAAERLGIVGKQSTFPAKKALSVAQRLGSERVGEFVTLLARADLDLHGARNWPPELVVEVLVARLAGRSRAARR